MAEDGQPTGFVRYPLQDDGNVEENEGGRGPFRSPVRTPSQ